MAVTNNSFAAKLDISSENNFSIKSFENLINQNKNYNLSYYNLNSQFSFALKNITLEETDNSWMDASVGFKYFSIDSSSRTLNSLYIKEFNQFYQNDNPYYFFVDKAYIKVYNFIYNDIVATFGRQPYTLSMGNVLSDNSEGLNGVRLEFLNKLKMDSIDFLYFRENNPYSEENISENIYGVSLNKSFGDGLWNLYYIANSNNGKTKDISFDSNKTDKKFSGISYLINSENISYTSEFSLEKGNSKDISGKNINHNAYSLSINATWKMEIPRFGNSNARFVYLKSSGNPNSTFTENKAFYSPYSKRFNGYERIGVGEIYRASIFDTSKTSDTLNGLPDGLSGITTVGFGADLIKGKRTISLDYFGYKATQAFNSDSGQSLGTEFDIKYSFDMGEKLNFYLVYATFSPKSGIKKPDIKSTKLFSLNIKARF